MGAVNVAWCPSGAVTLAGRVPGSLRRRQGRGGGRPDSGWRLHPAAAALRRFRNSYASEQDEDGDDREG